MLSHALFCPLVTYLEGLDLIHELFVPSLSRYAISQNQTNFLSTLETIKVSVICRAIIVLFYHAQTNALELHVFTQNFGAILYKVPVICRATIHLIMLRRML